MADINFKISITPKAACDMLQELDSAELIYDELKRPAPGKEIAILVFEKYYFRSEIQGTKWIRAFSEYPLPGFVKMERKTIAPWYSTIGPDKAVSGSWLEWDGDNIARDENGIVKLKANAAQFRGGYGAGSAPKDGTYNSQLGMPRTAIDKAGARNNCKNGTHIGAYRAYNEIAWLQRCEYASLNCQEEFNPALTADGFRQGGIGLGPYFSGAEWNEWGGYTPFVPCGSTAILGNNSGVVSYILKGLASGDKTIQINSYRGFECPFDYLWMLADDLLINHGSERSIAYVCEDPSKFTSHSDNSASVPDGYIAIADLSRQEGWIKQLTHSDKGYSFPESIGASANTGACDYFWTPGSSGAGWYGALLAAGAGDGAGTGFGYLSTASRSSYSDARTGFRLCRF